MFITWNNQAEFTMACNLPVQFIGETSPFYADWSSENACSVCIFSHISTYIFLRIFYF
jgi:hypothetical protein